VKRGLIETHCSFTQTTCFGVSKSLAYRLNLHSFYESVHAVFNESALRPWFSGEDSRTLSDELPSVLAHPALNKVVQVLHRRNYKRAPKNCYAFDIPAQYLCAQRS
jgi:hypothetical protein